MQALLSQLSRIEQKLSSPAYRSAENDATISEEDYATRMAQGIETYTEEVKKQIGECVADANSGGSNGAVFGGGGVLSLSKINECLDRAKANWTTNHATTQPQTALPQPYDWEALWRQASSTKGEFEVYNQSSDTPERQVGEPFVYDPVSNGIKRLGDWAPALRTKTDLDGLDSLANESQRSPEAFGGCRLQIFKNSVCIECKKDGRTRHGIVVYKPAKNVAAQIQPRAQQQEPSIVTSLLEHAATTKFKVYNMGEPVARNTPPLIMSMGAAAEIVQPLQKWASSQSEGSTVFNKLSDLYEEDQLAFPKLLEDQQQSSPKNTYGNIKIVTHKKAVFLKCNDAVGLVVYEDASPSVSRSEHRMRRPAQWRPY